MLIVLRQALGSPTPPRFPSALPLAIQVRMSALQSVDLVRGPLPIVEPRVRSSPAPPTAHVYSRVSLVSARTVHAFDDDKQVIS